MRARLRHHEDVASETLTIGPPDVAGRDRRAGPPGHAATARPIALTPLEFDLLVALARKPRQVFTREVLLEQVWGYRHAADTRLVNVHVQRLRVEGRARSGAPRGRAHRPRRRVQSRPAVTCAGAGSAGGRRRRGCARPRDGRPATARRCGRARASPAAARGCGRAVADLAALAAAARRHHHGAGHRHGGADHRHPPGRPGVRRHAAGQEARGGQPGQDRPGRAAAMLRRQSTPSVSGDVESAQHADQADLTASGSSAGLFIDRDRLDVAGTAAATTDTVIPAALRRLVQRGNLAVQYAPVPATRAARLVPGLIVGEPVPGRDGGLFELYYLFPLTAEAADDRAACSAPCCSPGSRWCCSSLAIALLVTRQVVRPVRVAAADRRPAGRGRPVAAHHGARHATTSPGWASRSTTWPAACNARSAGWRTSRGCSAGSPATSRTSCARR